MTNQTMNVTQAQWLATAKMHERHAAAYEAAGMKQHAADARAMAAKCLAGSKKANG